MTDRKMGRFEQMLTLIDEDQIEAAQNIDYDLWNYSLQQYPQGLYDMLCLDAKELGENEIKERRAILDAAYVYLQSTMEEISKELKKRYSNECSRLNY
ncbi:hypothetical protein NDS46_30450 (plasmid) [Paenibacillus thiaminolyticus]|uniref:hypothetical protein n=1 Tax=Paenibacillus thiaminolyticus TaxID=49283 RepID=UPI00232E895C|nr:hypothetical protein [Paenibacillus thiaminolyticus]WCF11670.1 hypothetical protein NDS46_30450 [Paenibacillus thiaminolyticus]